MPAVGSILTVSANGSTYVDDFPYARNGTITSFTNNTITLDAGASSVLDFYVGMDVWINSGIYGYNPRITAYDGTTKVASIGGWNGGGFNASNPAVNQWSAGTPVVGQTWYLISNYPVIRTFSWMKDGVDIADSVGPSFTPSVSGSYQVKEVARRYANDLTPGPTTTTISAPSVITGTRASNLVYKEDLTYLGCFRPPSLTNIYGRGFDYGGPIVYNPAGDGGAGSLFIRGHVYDNLVTEISIPAQGTWATNDSAAVPAGTALTGAWYDPIEGQLGTSGIAGAGGIRIGGLGIYGGKLIVTAHDTYANSTPASWFWQRPLNLATTGSVEGPLSVTDVLTSNTYPRNNPRCFAGYTALVPSSLQAQLGGPMLCGLSAQSIVSNTSDGPAINSFDPANFTGVSARRGTVTTATSTSLTLDGGASATPNFYVGYRVTNGSGSTGLATVTAYDGTTKVATITSWTTPSAGDTWVLVPPVSAKSMALYETGQLQTGVDWQYQGVMNWTGRVLAGAVVPNSTKSVLVFGKGGRGLYQYAIPTLSNGKARYFSNTISTGTPGERAWPNGPRVRAYNIDELEQVRLGNTPLANIKPYAVWNFDFPFKGEADWASGGVTYDTANKRIFAACSGLPFANPVIHVWQITGSSATPG
jgi:hypothetical protein